MATFLVLQQELQDKLVAFDQTVTADATKLKRWLNLAQQYICSKYLWSFMIADEVVQTVVDYTTGTVSVSAAGTTATFSATIADSKTNQYIKFASSNDWYKITAHTAGASTATISPAAISAEASTAYTIRKLLYTTTTPLIQILDMKQLVTPIRIISESPTELDYIAPLSQDAGTPYYYIMAPPNSSGDPQFSFLSSPDTAMNIRIRGIQKLTDMSADADISLIPVPWHDAIVNIAAFFGFQGLDDNRSKSEFQAGEIRIQDMKNNYAPDLGRHRVMRPVDDGVSSGFSWRLPSNYGPWVD